MPPFQYQAPQSPYAMSIAETLARRGDIRAQQAMMAAQARAQAQQASGQAWGGAVQQIGQQVGTAVTGYAREREEAPIRAQARDARELELSNAREEQASRARASAQDRALMDLFSGEQMPDPQAIMRVVGPQRGAAIVQGMSALQEIASKSVKDARETAGRLAV